jgi:hypothetical protein
VNPNKDLWEKGDFTRIAATVRESGVEVVQDLGDIKGLKVLDLGCGDGTTARPEAVVGADAWVSTSPAIWSPPALAERKLRGSAVGCNSPRAVLPSAGGGAL